MKQALIYIECCIFISVYSMMRSTRCMTAASKAMTCVTKHFAYNPSTTEAEATPVAFQHMKYCIDICTSSFPAIESV